MSQEKFSEGDMHNELSHKPSMAPTFGSRQDADERPDMHLRTYMAVVASSLGYGATLYALVATAISGRDVQAALPSNAALALFANVPFTLVQAILGPPVAHLSDNSGRRWYIIGCFIIALAGAYVSSEAKSMAAFVAGRVLSAQCCTVLPLLLTIPSEVLPHRYRAYGQGAASVGAGVGCVLACTVPAAFATNGAGWRWTFRFEGIIQALTLALIFFAYNPPKRPGVQQRTTMELLKTVHWTSAFLIALFLLPFTVACTLGGSIHPWSSPRIIAPLVIGLVGLVLLIAHSYFKSDTLLDHRLFQNGRNFPIALALIALEGMGFFLFVGFTPPQSGLVFGSAAQRLGGRLMMGFLGLMSGGVIYGIYTSKTKDVRTPLVAGFGIATAAFIGYTFAYTNTTTNERATWATAYLVGFGLAAPSAIGLVLAQLATPGHLIGLSSAVFLSVRGVFGTIGSVTGNSIVNNKIATEIPGRVIPAIIQLGIPPTPANIGTILGYSTHFETEPLAGFLIQNGVAPQNVGRAIGAILGAQGTAFAASYRWVFVAAAPVCFAGVVFSLFISSVRDRMNWIIDAPAEEIHHSAHHQSDHA